MERTCRLGLLLVPGFSHLGLALVTEPLFIANWLAGSELFRWTTLSADGLAVQSSSGARLAVDQPLSSALPFEMVLVIASFDSRAAAEDPRILQWLRRAARLGIGIGGIETGCEIVAAAGLLDGLETPMHWYNIAGAQERLPDVRAARTLFSNSQRHPLSAGGLATLDLMLDILSHQAGAALAREVAHHLLIEGPRAGTDRQPAAPGEQPATPAAQSARDPAIAARQMIETGLDEPLTLPELARRAGCSARHLQRLFRARFGQSVQQVRTDLRMAAAHQLVQQTALPLTEVAVACGFASLEVFSRNYRRRFGVAPSRDRRQSTDATVFRPSASRDGGPRR